MNRKDIIMILLALWNVYMTNAYVEESHARREAEIAQIGCLETLITACDKLAKIQNATDPIHCEYSVGTQTTQGGTH